MQRDVLFLDVLRPSANDMLEHEPSGPPPLLDFERLLKLDRIAGRGPTGLAQAKEKP